MVKLGKGAPTSSKKHKLKPLFERGENCGARRPIPDMHFGLQSVGSRTDSCGSNICPHEAMKPTQAVAGCTKKETGNFPLHIASFGGLLCKALTQKQKQNT